MVLRCAGWTRWLAALVAPRSCPGCDEPIDERLELCAPCARAWSPAAPGRHLAAFAFEGAVRSAVLRLKYQRRSDVAAPLGRLLALTLEEQLPQVELVVPVPLHPLRLVERGFNQAALLAAPLARALGAPLSTSVLARSSFQVAQASLGREDRQANVRGAFRCVARARVTGRAIALVDDVVTTGATLDACAEALRAEGAREVVAVALARASAMNGEAPDQRDVIRQPAEMTALAERVRALEI